MNNECWGWFCDHMRILSDYKLHFLINEEIDIEGITFYGTPFIEPIDFQPGKWAFESVDIHDYCAGNHTNVMITHDSPFKNECLSSMRNPISLPKMHYWFFGHCHDGEDEPGNGIYNCSRLDGCYNFKKNYEFVIVDIMTRREIINEVMEYFTKNKLFQCPESNIIDTHNKKILELFIKYLDEQEDGPVLEDTIPWEHPMENVDSAIITDFID